MLNTGSPPCNPYTTVFRTSPDPAAVEMTECSGFQAFTSIYAISIPSELTPNIHDNIIVMDIDNILAGWPTYEIKFMPQKPGRVSITLSDALFLIPGYCSCILPIMSADVLDIIDLYDGDGAVIFSTLECQNWGKPIFWVMKSADVRPFAGSQMAGEHLNSVLIALNGLYDKPLMLRSMVRSITKDVTMECVYAELVELAKFLVMEAQKEEGPGYASAKERKVSDVRNSGQRICLITLHMVTTTFSFLIGGQDDAI
ncbi:hypothetical protein EV702DRAFT_1042594 [Suillus placidus]|uniref:Uncharacterized protein n=1 Tax=Suillus placidus TaxID=48579 RepID=A0A9P7A3P6_9AGAM|nr:hypothetical protein EV702DRAFT_1042594 [Suillus placidus]